MAVDYEELPVVAADPAKRALQSRRVERAYRDAGRTQRREERVIRVAKSAEPVVDQGYVHAGTSPGVQQVADLPSDGVVGDEIVLEQHVLAGRFDQSRPGLEMGLAVDQQLHAVSAHERRSGRTAEGLASQQAQRGLMPSRVWGGIVHTDSVVKLLAALPGDSLVSRMPIRLLPGGRGAG